MYSSAEAHPGHSRAAKINLYTRIVKHTSLEQHFQLFLPKLPSWMIEQFDYPSDLF